MTITEEILNKAVERELRVRKLIAVFEALTKAFSKFATIEDSKIVARVFLKTMEERAGIAPDKHEEYAEQKTGIKFVREAVIEELDKLDAQKTADNHPIQ